MTYGSKGECATLYTIAPHTSTCDVGKQRCLLSSCGEGTLLLIGFCNVMSCIHSVPNRALYLIRGAKLTVDRLLCDIGGNTIGRRTFRRKTIEQQIGQSLSGFKRILKVIYYVLHTRRQSSHRLPASLIHCEICYANNCIVLYMHAVGLWVNGSPAWPSPAQPSASGPRVKCSSAGTVVLLACRANKGETHADRPRVLLALAL